MTSSTDGTRYAKELTGNIEWNYKQLGDMGIEELNKVASSHSVVLAEDPSVEVSGCDIVDGSLRILFGKGQLGNGISQATTVDKIIDAVSKAEATSGAAADLDYHARSSIKDDYEPKIGAVSDRIKKILALPDLVLEPNFEATFAALSAASDRSRLDGIWQKQLGSFLIEYFESLANNLEYEGFGKDELMQEAFAEGVESKKVEFQIVNKLQKGEYNEVAVEDGVLYIRTVPGSWGTNIHNTGKGLVDLL